MIQTLIIGIIKSIIKFGGEDEEREFELLNLHLTLINLKKIFFIVCVWDDGCEVSLLWQSFYKIYINQIIMLCTLNLYSDVHQLFLNKTGKKTFKIAIYEYYLNIWEWIPEKPNKISKELSLAKD